jgi:integrase
MVAGELAAGRNPAETLRALLNPPAPVKVRTLTDWGPLYVASRHDVQNVRAMQGHLKRVTKWGGERNPDGLTVADCQEFLASLVADMKPDSIKRYWGTFRLLLDFAGVEPNPARDKRIKLPSVVINEPTPPTAKQVLAILDNIADKPKILPLVVMEQIAIEPGVVASLEWGDVDVAENRFRLKRRNVKGNTSVRARSPQVPGWLMDVIEDTCPLEDRTAERRVFPGAHRGRATERGCQGVQVGGHPALLAL